MPAEEETTGDPRIDTGDDEIGSRGSDVDHDDRDDDGDPRDPGARRRSDLGGRSDHRDDRDDREVEGRAVAGAARSPSRRVARGVIVLVAGAALAAVVVQGANLGSGGGSGEPSEPDGSASPGGDGAATSVTTVPAAGTVVQSSTSSSVAPPDVAHVRPPVDLAATPDPADMVGVARWWAATFVTYVPAEQAADLVDRLDPFTSPDLRGQLLAVPPAASYDVPEQVVGVSAQVAPGGTTAGGNRLTVVVETPRGLAVYELVMVQAGGAWQVDEANRV